MQIVVGLLVVFLLALVAWAVLRRLAPRPRAHREERAQPELRTDARTLARKAGWAANDTNDVQRYRGAAVWIPAEQPTTIRGYSIPGGMIYVGSHLACAAGLRAADPALINPELPVEPRAPARSGEGMTYWPSYSEIAPACRAAYLEWLAGGRRDPAAYIGYVFLFFYGLERHVLVERQDVASVRAEVRRLLGVYAGNNSFRGYATSFLATTGAADLASMTESAVHDGFGATAEAGDLTSLATLLAWHHDRRQPLPAKLAATIAAGMEDAQRSVVATRSRSELLELFSLRYGEQYGEGLVVEAGPRPITFTYRPASAGLLLHPPAYVLPDVLGRRKQFKPLVGLWNGCIEDLKRYATAQRKKADESAELTPSVWEAMPPDLRSRYDHPDRGRWDATVLAAPRCGAGHLMAASELAGLCRLPAREKYTGVQLRKVAETAAHLGFAMEPEPRAASAVAPATAPFVVWRSRFLDPPDPKLYAPMSTVLKLAMSVATADGTVHEQEIAKVSEMVETLFVLDEVMRERMAMLRDLLVHHPAKLGGLTRKLAESRTPEQRRAVGRLLVAIAAADGILQPEEHRALRVLFRSLGLAAADLDGILAAFGLRVSSDEPVVVVPATRPSAGSAVRAPEDDAPPSATLDPKAIEAVLADTREVAALLAEVFEDDDEDASPLPSATPPQPGANDTSCAAFGLSEASLEGLDAAVRPVLAELLERKQWTLAEVREVCGRHRVMSTAVLDAINAWSDEAVGDYLIVANGSWSVRLELLGRLKQ